MGRHKTIITLNRLFIVIFISLILAFQTGCQDDDDDDNGGGKETATSFTYSKDLGSTPSTVYFIFTNDTYQDLSITPVVNVTSSSSPSLSYNNFEADLLLHNNLNELQDPAGKKGYIIKGKEEINEFYKNLPQMTVKDDSDQQQSMVLSTEPHYYTLGESHTFIVDNNGNTVDATFRGDITDDGIKLNLWVANNALAGSCDKEFCMTQEMLDAMGGKFLDSDSSNDIYYFMTNIFGNPWGSHSYNNLIAETAKNEIDILFYDIDNDNATSGGVVGFYHPKDIYLNSNVEVSNERLMFYIDSVFTAQPEDTTWDVTDYWPSEMVATLAHEFQHMIHFYEKEVSRGASSETWINEMCSMAAEDLLASKIEVDGPRGVAWDDGSAGLTENEQGRIPLYNAFTYVGVADWYSGNDVYISYSINYVLGAYLSRNFGGAQFFQNVVQNDFADYRAIEYALTASGSGETFSSAMQKWGSAVIQSDITADVDYRYNIGRYFSSSAGNVIYDLGSINFYNYNYVYDKGTLEGPGIYTPAGLGNLSKVYKTSNILVKAAENVTGNFTAKVTMSSGMKYNVLIR